MERFSDLHRKFAPTSSSYAEATTKAIKELDEELTPSERKHLEGYGSHSEDITSKDWPGKTALMGSSAWVRDAQQRGHQVKGVLCLETMGYVSTRKNSQQFPEGLDPDMMKIFNTDSELTTGDFLTIVGDRNSGALADSFCEQCEVDTINLPYACLQEDFDYEQAAYIMPDLLRSDHAPFWRAGIPALMLTDTADFRYPYYHTHADTIDKLDFDFLAKICRAVVATALSF